MSADNSPPQDRLRSAITSVKKGLFSSWLDTVITFVLALGLIAVFLAVFEKEGQELVKHQQMLHNALGWLRYAKVDLVRWRSLMMAAVQSRRTPSAGSRGSWTRPAARAALSIPSAASE